MKKKTKRELQKKLVAMINIILARDLPGWKVAPGEKIDTGRFRTTYVKVTNGSLEKLIIIDNGKVISAQG